MTALVTRPTIQIANGFQVSRTGLEVDGVPSWEDCASLGKRLPILEQALQFAFGDFAIYVEGRFGEQAAQIIDASDGWSESTVRVYRWVCEKVAPTNRRVDLSFQHHQIVAALGAKEQRTWLAKAAAEGWTVSDLRQAITGSPDAAVIAVWLVVKCKDRADLETLQADLEAKGRLCKVTEERERRKVDKVITAKAKRRSKTLPKA
jgi:hypothetical protein